MTFEQPDKPIKWIRRASIQVPLDLLVVSHESMGFEDRNEFMHVFNSCLNKKLIILQNTPEHRTPVVSVDYDQLMYEKHAKTVAKFRQFKGEKV